ncbi:MAG: aminoacyl--tRNA ligase-related protein [Candidatus Nanoarchaeia archaeon]
MKKPQAKNEKTPESKSDSKLNSMPLSLTAKKSSDYPEWLSQILQLAKIIDNRYAIKSMFVWMPYGYDMMLRIKKFWDNEFKLNGIKEMYFPLMVPVEYAEQNDSWWAGFKEEGFWAGTKNKQEYIIRPTGEPAMYPMFSLWTRSYSDLPLRIYQTVFSYRYETKQTRPLIRDREIGPWYEIHTAHATKQEAEEEIELARKMNDKIWEFIAVKPLITRKPKWECFPGAEGALEYYTLMPNGKVMENGSLNNLGQAYAKKFNIKFIDKEGKENFAWQTCTGNGERFLSASLSQHGDDFGLVLPPNIAPVQVMIIPIFNDKNKEKILKVADKIKQELSDFRVEVNTKNDSLGSKFFDSEIIGVPLRIEFGEKELDKNSLTLFFRNTRTKKSIMQKEVVKEVALSMENIQKELLKNSANELSEAIKETSEISQIPKLAENKKIAKIYWCLSPDCYDKISSKCPGLELIGSDINNAKEGKCIACSAKTTNQAYVASSY